MFEKIIRSLNPVKDNVVRFYKEYIIDIETTGLDPREDIIICLGIADLYDLTATIYFLDKPEAWKEFQRFCRSRVKEMLSKGKVWAYNCRFEADFLGVPVRVDGYGLKDLMCGTIWLKLRDAAWFIAGLYGLKVNRCIEDDDVEGKDVPMLYLKDWCIYKDEKAKYLIIDHNYRDLVRAYLVRYHLRELAKKLQDELRKNGPIPVFLYGFLESFK